MNVILLVILRIHNINLYSWINNNTKNGFSNIHIANKINIIIDVIIIIRVYKLPLYFYYVGSIMVFT